MGKTTRPSQTTTEAELVRTVRAIYRLQTQARKLRRQLKRNQADLRHERRMLRGLQQALAARDAAPDIAPMRLFAGAVGIRKGDGDA
jgi:hypothetical protein